MSNEKFYTSREEKANYLTHAAGVLMALVATVLLLRKAILADNRWAMLAYAIFGFGMLACMLSSTVYHFVQEPGRKVKWRHFDHASIYLLIAASYSPFTLILLREERFWGWLLFGLVWIIALVGIAVSFGELKKNSHLKTASYVFMGLVVLVAFKPLIETANEKNCIEVIGWLIAGGVFYITGAIIYATARREFVHAVFHLFVLFGLASHIIGAGIIPLD
ncbi:MAG: hemolysin III family protein [Petrimonas sp.]|nr:hemolysin III family protein [Petrimonas sp.]MEA5070401.1 hemolysin III family protein [Petrimonas sp.]